TTRYAHNQKNLVKEGDLVEKGQKIALLGSTGRSTGPHVHFEVRKDEKPVNPVAFIRQNKE
ncbi:MAG: M23 family metallopeptidase, partial [Sedimenticolaceae bacterium]|nr:M23 family metallopeptidase [Sedimenticolaceae bacterium]